MSISSFFTGEPGKFQQLPRFSAQQQGLQNNILNQLPGMLNQVGNNNNANSFAPIAQKARTQFNTQTIPGIAERFTAMGGGLSDSGFQTTLGQAGAGLEESLAALESQHGLAQQGQQQNLLLNLLGLGFQPQNENIYMPDQPGFLHGAASGFGQGLGSIGGGALAGFATGGPAGAAAGAGGGFLQWLLSKFGGGSQQQQQQQPQQNTANPNPNAKL